MESPSGPRIARAFQTVLAGIFLVAWSSLAVQLPALYGSRGLLPIATLMDALHASPEGGFFTTPSVFWWGANDVCLWAAAIVGGLCASAAVAGLWPRWMLLFSTLLYMSFATTGRTFLSFQWDNLLLEAGFLAALLPRDRPSVWVHTVFRLLLFKLYFESGVAKWQSSLGDWRDGSAMLLYFETAPLPTWVAWHAHHLPDMLLRALSYATLVLELGVPWLVFGPRAARLTACIALTVFQLINIATANYGFFCLLALALHLFLLDEHDLSRWPAKRVVLRPEPRVARVGTVLACAVYVYISVGQAATHFWDLPRWPAVSLLDPLRIINPYHLFGAITRVRIEPEIQVDSGKGWVAYPLLHKPGDVMRAPDFVAPHQPRLDFQLWFHGLSAQTWPAYLDALLTSLCREPDAVQTFFSDLLPEKPRAVRVTYWRYQFTDAATHARTGAYWQRKSVGERAPRSCF